MSTSALGSGEWFTESFHHHTKAERMLGYLTNRRLSGYHSWSGHAGEKENLKLLGIYVLLISPNPGTLLT
jgi:hypothetical protein